MNYNRVILAGRLTRDPEVKTTASGVVVAQLGLAVNSKRGDKEEVLFIDATAFAKTAEMIGQYFKKGSGIMVEGRLRLETWDDKQTGAKRSKTTVTVDNFTFTDSKKDDEQHAPSVAQTRTTSPRVTNNPAPVDPDDDLPF